MKYYCGVGPSRKFKKKCLPTSQIQHIQFITKEKVPSRHPFSLQSFAADYSWLNSKKLSLPEWDSVNFNPNASATNFNQFRKVVISTV